MTDFYNQNSKRIFSIKVETKITGKLDIMENNEDVRILMQDKSSFFVFDDMFKPLKQYQADDVSSFGDILQIALHPSLEKFAVLTENKLYSISFTENSIEKECAVEGAKQITYSPDGKLLWGVEYISDNQFRIFVRDGDSLTLLATEVYEDELFRSSFFFTHLPEANYINLHQAAGQDGSMNSFLSYNNGSIEMTKIAQLDEYIVPEFRKDKKEFVTVTYPEGFTTFTYPECKELFTHEVDIENEEYCGFNIFYLNDHQIVYEINEHLWQLFDLNLKANVGSFVIEGHEPKETCYYYPRLKDDTDLITDVYALRSYGNHIIGKYTDYRIEDKPSFLCYLKPS